MKLTEEQIRAIKFTIISILRYKLPDINIPDLTVIMDEDSVEVFFGDNRVCTVTDTEEGHCVKYEDWWKELNEE